MIKLSIIIVNYNTGELLIKCLHSIKTITKNFSNPSTEVIVVDNASTDESMEGVKSTTSATRIIINKENLGFAKAVNQGIQKSKGEYILLLNPDTKVTNGALSSLLKFAKEYDDVGVVGARLLDPDGMVQASVFHFPTIWRAIREFWLGQQGTYSKYIPKGNKPSIVDAVVGAAFLITPQARKKVGLLDEGYFMYFEDLDYCRRVWKAGLKAYYLPSATVVHHHGASGKGVLGEANQWRRLIPSSKLYHGKFRYYLINFIIWSGLKFRSFFKLRN